MKESPAPSQGFLLRRYWFAILVFDVDLNIYIFFLLYIFFYLLLLLFIISYYNLPDWMKESPAPSQGFLLRR